MQDITLPDKNGVERYIKSVFRLLFPLTHAYSEKEKEDYIADLSLQFIGIQSGTTHNKEHVAKQFFNSLDSIKKTLLKDAGFILESDPAATQLIEVIGIYPGFKAIFCYRIANCLAKLAVPFIPRMITEYAHKVTGIDIHPGAEIGCPFSIDHGTGIVIGETTKIILPVILFFRYGSKKSGFDVLMVMDAISFIFTARFSVSHSIVSICIL